MLWIIFRGCYISLSFYPNMSTFHLTSKNQSLLVKLHWRCRGSCGFLLYTAALSVGIFGAKTQFSFVVFQVQQLLGVECSTTLPAKHHQNKNNISVVTTTTWVWAITGMTLNTAHCKTEKLVVQSSKGENIGITVWYSQSDEVHSILIFHPTLN